MSTARSLDDLYTDIIVWAEKEGLKVHDIDKIKSAKAEGIKDLLVGRGLCAEGILDHALKGGYLQLVQKDSPYFEQEIKSSLAIASNPRSIVEYPISSILTPDDISINNEKKHTKLNVRFSAAVEKHDILMRLDKVVGEISRSSSLKTDIATIADELLTNAIFNAPFVSYDDQSSVISRKSTDIKMGDGKTGEFFCAQDDSRILVGCRDPYGRLNVQKMLERIRKCYSSGVAANLNMKSPGGAGIGSYMVFNLSSSFYVVVDKNRITLVCSVVPLKGSARVRLESPKCLHHIVLDQEE